VFLASLWEEDIKVAINQAATEVFTAEGVTARKRSTVALAAQDLLLLDGDAGSTTAAAAVGGWACPAARPQTPNHPTPRQHHHRPRHQHKALVVPLPPRLGRQTDRCGPRWSCWPMRFTLPQLSAPASTLYLDQLTTNSMPSPGGHHPDLCVLRHALGDSSTTLIYKQTSTTRPTGYLTDLTRQANTRTTKLGQNHRRAPAVVGAGHTQAGPRSQRHQGPAPPGRARLEPSRSAANSPPPSPSRAPGAAREDEGLWMGHLRLTED
jgi:hypothetical protein